MLDLESAIKHAEEVAEENEKSLREWKECKNRGTAGWSDSDKEQVDTSITRCSKCAAEHRQLAEWLKDYKRLKEQEPCEDEYIKVPKKALKYRTAGMVAYNVEWLKNHFDIERAVICGALQPYADAISRQAVLDKILKFSVTDGRSVSVTGLWTEVNELPPVTPQEPCEDAISRQAVLDLIEHYNSDGLGSVFYGYEEGVKFADKVKKLPPITSQEPCDDTISRQAAIDALWKALYDYEDKTQKQFQESKELDVGDWIQHRIFVQNMNDIDRQTILELPPVTPQPKTIQEKQAESEKYDKAFDDGYENGYAQARFDYEQEPKMGHWIPVSEELPDKEGYYLCSVRYMYPPYNFFEPEKVKYMDDVTIQKFDGEFNIEVKAWMSLPPCYKPQESEDQA